MLTGNSVEEKIMNYLVSKGLTSCGAAGIMGNLQAESGMSPNRVEILCLKRLAEAGKTYNDTTYTAAVDSGKINRAEFLNPLPGKQYGYGLAQWTSPSRKAGLYDLVKKRGVSIADLETQLDWLMDELNTSYKKVLSVLKSAKTIQEASDYVLCNFEQPANCGTSVKSYRAKLGQSLYNQLVSKKSDKGEIYTFFMESIAADQTHGYSQANRWGPDYDCSSLVITALENAGIPAKTNGASYTGNMYPVLTALGFVDVTKEVNLITGEGLIRSDILLRHTKKPDGSYSGHTAVYTGNRKIVHARGQSYGTSATGDRGEEIAVTSYYNSPWNYVLRWNGAVKSTNQSTTASKEDDFMFSVGTVQNGSKGNDAKLLQQLLNANGASLLVDGECGNATSNAVKAYQKKNGLVQDGIAGPKTWSKLLLR